MARRSRKSDDVVVRVRLPERLATALGGDVSKRSTGRRSNETSRDELVSSLLCAMIRQLKTDPSSITRLLVAEAVRESAEEFQLSAIASLRPASRAQPAQPTRRKTAKRSGVR